MARIVHQPIPVADAAAITSITIRNAFMPCLPWFWARSARIGPAATPTEPHFPPNGPRREALPAFWPPRLSRLDPHQNRVPGGPLNGPTTFEVIQPP